MSFPWNITNPGVLLTGLLTSEEKQFVVDLFELSYANGDILYYNTGQFQRLPVGTDGQYLKLVSGLPAWAAGGGGGGYTTLAEFVDETPWRIFYSNTSGDVTPLAFGTSGQYLKSNGATSAPSWETPTGTGDVVGPASATDNAIARYDGTTGKLVQNSTATVGDTGAIATTIAAAGNAVGITVTQNDTTNNPRAISITNTGTGNAVLIDQNGAASTSTSVGGALLVENTGNSGAGVVIYSNHATATGRLLSVRADNTGFATQPVYVENDGTSHAVSIVHNSTNSNANAITATSTNENDSTLGISGRESGKGTVKITHNKPNGVADTNASAISISLDRVNVAETSEAQGIFIDSTHTTTGKLLNIRNNGSDRFILNADGTGTFSGDISVPDEAYGVGWDGSLEVPTKNAIYDKIETLGTAAAPSRSARMGWVFPDSTINGATDIAAERWHTISAMWYELTTSGDYLKRDTSGYGANFYYTAANALIVRENATVALVNLSSGNSTYVNALTSNSTKRSNLITEMISFCETNNFDGVDLDLETFAVASMSAGQYTDFKTLITELGNALHAEGLILSIEVPPIWNTAANTESGSGDAWDGNNSQGYYRLVYSDFNTLPVDQVVVMAYDYQYDYSAGEPNQPLKWLEEIMRFARQSIDETRTEIVAGIPSAGYSGATGGYAITGRTYDYLSVQTGFGGASRDAGSGELIWANGGTSYAAIDDTSIQLKVAQAEAVGIYKYALWHIGDNQYGGSTLTHLHPQNERGSAYAKLTQDATFATVTINTSLVPDANDGAAIGTTALGFSDLFLATGAIINWNNGETLLTETSAGLSLSNTAAGATGPILELYQNSASPVATDITGMVSFFGKDSAANKQEYARIVNEIDDPTSTSEDGHLKFGVTTAGTLAYELELIGTSLYPTTNDGLALGTTSRQYSDLFLAEGGVINWDNGDATLTQVGDVVTLAGADLKITTPGTASTSVVTTDGTQGMTNKRITSRTGTTTSSATPTISTDNVDFYSLTAQAVDITSFTTNLTGTPTENQTLWIAITGTATRAITWGASFEASTVALPTTTVTTNRLDVGFVWNTVTSKWRCIASA